MKLRPYCWRQASTSLRDCTGYVPGVIEAKWQSKWSKKRRTPLERKGDKFYMLSMFPYPSGRLHMGHVRVYTISDTIAHFQRMRGKNVLHPMGWDAFGLPAENAAIDRNTSPLLWTQDNIAHMRTQLDSLGFHFDWHKEVTTCSPRYYKWTQWLFLQLYRHGKAYKKKAVVNWDPVDQTVLANEQVDDQGHSWRSGAVVEQRYLNQWFFKITDYAEALLEGLEELDWPSSVKLMQANWIGKSEGAFFDFKLEEVWSAPPLRVFTTRPETLGGVSFLAVSPEHPIAGSTSSSSSRPHAIHPLTGDPIPVYTADYVITDYSTQAVMGVPAHDDRDREFAESHDLPILSVINEDKLVDSQQFSGLSVEQAKHAIVEYALSRGFGGHMTQYKLRDWLISRQRYWGTPIPMLYCDQCGVVPVNETSLPVTLPLDVKISGRGPSPLTLQSDWLRASCGKPGCSARRESDTMDTFIDSSWYFLRYTDASNQHRPFSKEVNTWMPVDLYVGGIEHAILHLLYARFINHFLHDIGEVKEREPFKKLLTQGMVQGQTYKEKGSGRYLLPGDVRDSSQVEVLWEKMSKSKHNGVEPEDIIAKYGADTVRLFMLFKAPPEAAIQWDVGAIQGVHRWLHRVWGLCRDHVLAASEQRQVEHSNQSREERQKISMATHKAVKQVTAQLEERLVLNVAVSELMILSNVLRDLQPSLSGSPEYHASLSTLCRLLAPMAPHLAAELWEGLKEACQYLSIPEPRGSVLDEAWPSWSDKHIQQDMVNVVIQVDGMKKKVVSVSTELLSQREQLEAHVHSVAMETGILGNETVSKVYVGYDGKVVNFVTKK